MRPDAAVQKQHLIGWMTKLIPNVTCITMYLCPKTFSVQHLRVVRVSNIIPKTASACIDAFADLKNYINPFWVAGGYSEFFPGLNSFLYYRQLTSSTGYIV